MPLSARYALAYSFAGFDTRLYILDWDYKKSLTELYWVGPAVRCGGSPRCSTVALERFS